MIAHDKWLGQHLCEDIKSVCCMQHRGAPATSNNPNRRATYPFADLCVRDRGPLLAAAGVILSTYLSRANVVQVTIQNVCLQQKPFLRTHSCEYTRLHTQSRSAVKPDLTTARQFVNQPTLGAQPTTVYKASRHSNLCSHYEVVPPLWCQRRPICR